MEFSVLATTGIVVAVLGLGAALLLRRGAGQRRRGRLMGSAVSFGLILLNTAVVLSISHPLIEDALIHDEGYRGMLLWWTVIIAALATLFIMPILMLVAVVQFVRGICATEPELQAGLSRI